MRLHAVQRREKHLAAAPNSAGGPVTPRHTFQGCVTIPSVECVGKQMMDGGSVRAA